LEASTHEALGHGNNMAFRRSCFERHGLYMEWLGPGTWATGADDTDFTFRLLRAGADVLYSPDPLVWHDNWRPIEQSNRQLYGYMFSASAVFTRHALRGSGVAARVQARFLRGYLKDLLRALRWRSWRAIRHHARLLRAFAGGGLFGALCVLRRPPRL
jgi:GT2 family glycosyltransferase